MRFEQDQKVGVCVCVCVCVSLASLCEPVEGHCLCVDSQQGLWLVARHSIL
jgi:hypothetical protein